MVANMNSFAKKLASKMLGVDTDLHPNMCVFCGEEVDIEKDFRDDLSRKEWEISHICQKCQDKVFE